MGEGCFSVICLSMCDGRIKGLPSKHNGLELMLEWFILAVPAVSAFNCCQQPLVLRTQGSAQVAGLVLERSKGPLK